MPGKVVSRAAGQQAESDVFEIAKAVDHLVQRTVAAHGDDGFRSVFYRLFSQLYGVSRIFAFVEPVDDVEFFQLCLHEREVFRHFLFAARVGVVNDVEFHTFLSKNKDKSALLPAFRPEKNYTNKVYYIFGKITTFML